MVLWKNLYTNAPTPTSLLVLGSETGPSGRVWLKLLLPKRPNGSVGWVPADELDPAPDDVARRDLDDPSASAWCSTAATSSSASR